MISPILLAVPLFAVGIALELWVAHKRQKQFYRFHDTLNNITCGVTSQIVGVFTKLAFLPLYAAVLSFVPWRFSGAVGWILCFVLVDFIYYWWHRLSHEINWMWAAHSVHHQSEDYNLGVALRQAWLTNLTIWPFHLPLALLGFPWEMYFLCSAINTVYQFWIHTRAIGRMGPLEWLLNTPSHHRVHHGINPIYIDKNYAGVLITWDRLFGSFEPESEEVVYGVVKPVGTYCPVKVNLQYFGDMRALSRTGREFLHALWLRPGMNLRGEMKAIPHVEAQSYQKFAGRSLSPAGYAFALLLFVAIFALGVYLLSAQATLSLLQLSLYAALALLLSYVLGRCLDLPAVPSRHR